MEEFPQETQPLLGSNIGEGTDCFFLKTGFFLRGGKEVGKGMLFTREIELKAAASSGAAGVKVLLLASPVTTAWLRRREEMSRKGKAISTGFQDPRH